MAEVCERLDSLSSGWAAYISRGARVPVYRAIDHHVETKVRRFLTRRHKVPSRGTRRFPREAVFGKLGVLRLRGALPTPPPCASR